MTLSSQDKAELRNRLQFYRELGIGPLYRREVANKPPQESVPEHVEATLTDELVSFQGEASQEGCLPTGDRELLLRVIRDDIGPNCTRCKLARLGRKQIVFGTGDPHAELMFIGEGPGADEDEQGFRSWGEPDNC